MIARKYRFHGLGSLRRVYSNGQVVRGPILAIKYLANDKRSAYRLAVVVSKKVHKSAVARNRMRRKVYEAVRRHEDLIAKPYDLVITVFHEQLLELSGAELDRMIKAQLKQAGVIKPTRDKI